MFTICCKESIILVYDKVEIILPTSDEANDTKWKMPPVEPDKSGCVIWRSRYNKDITRYTKDHPEKKRRCTLSFFQDYFMRTKQFYGQGVWYTPNVSFIPQDCTFSNHANNPRTLSKCLNEKNISKIFVIGDSTARYMFTNLVALFKNWSCTTDRWSDPPGNGQEDTYLLVPGIERNVIKRQPQSLMEVSRTVRCRTDTTNHSVVLEYIAMRRFLDTGIMTKKHDFKTPFVDAPNKLEYLLRYYFPYHGFPDLWLFKLPFRNEIWWRTSNEMFVHVEYTLQLLRLYLPTRTKLIFLSDSRECERNIPAKIMQEWHRKSTKITRNTQLHQANQVFYKTFSELARHLPGMYAFLDDMRLSCSMMCDFHRDGAHFVDS